MRIAMLGGGGAMGGLFGGLAEARGHMTVTLIDVSTDAIDCDQTQSGVTIEEKDGSVARCRSAPRSDPASVGPVDLIINFVKCYHTEAAVSAAEPMLGPGHGGAQPQNGWGNADAHRQGRRTKSGCWSGSPITARRCSRPAG